MTKRILTDEEKAEIEKNRKYKDTHIAYGMFIGIVLGSLFGLLIFGFSGLAIGAGLGIALGIVFGSNIKKDDSDE